MLLLILKIEVKHWSRAREHEGVRKVKRAVEHDGQIFEGGNLDFSPVLGTLICPMTSE
jgi:coproporphyrinogen III oxidase